MSGQPPAGPDRLPPDERAVLQLLLQQGSTYDKIAQLLSMDRAAVRARALSAVDALAPPADIPLQQRALITDYLLGQLPEAMHPGIRRRLSTSSQESAWARAAWTELAPISRRPGPEIPTPARGESPTGTAAGERAGRITPVSAGALPDPTIRRSDNGRAPVRRNTLRLTRSRVDAIWRVTVIVGVGVALILLVTAHPRHHSSPRSVGQTVNPTRTSATRASHSSSVRVLAKIRLTSPEPRAKSVGLADVLAKGSLRALAIVAQHVPPNTNHPPNAYAVWLYNSPSDATLLGFVSPGVKKNGELSTAGGVSGSSSRYRYILITLETRSNPKRPGKVVLEGQLRGL